MGKSETKWSWTQPVPLFEAYLVMVFFLAYFLEAMNLIIQNSFLPKLFGHKSGKRVEHEVLKSHMWLKSHGTGYASLRVSPISNDQLGGNCLEMMQG